MKSQSSAAPRYIAFLRAINVGGHVVKMEHLRRLFEALELSGVETFIASGNVIFEPPAASAAALETQIAGHLRQALGYDVTTFIRSTPELAAVAGYSPFPAAEPGNSLYVAFLHAMPGEQARQKLMSFRSSIDDFHVHEREIYWLCRGRMSDSAFSGALLEKAIGMPATMRNITTVRKLAAKYPAPGAA